MSLRVKPTVSQGALRDALNVNPWMWCEGCRSIVREKDMVGDLCSSCFYEYDERRLPKDEALTETETEHGDKAEGRANVPPARPKVLPVTGEREKETMTPKGQLALCLSGE